MEAFAFPPSVVGPVDFFAFLRFASTLFADAAIEEPPFLKMCGLSLSKNTVSDSQSKSAALKPSANSLKSMKPIAASF